MSVLLDPPVVIFPGVAMPRQVASAHEVVELLMDYNWPRTPGYRQPRDVTIAFHYGLATLEELRAAFVEAAREAGLLAQIN